MAIKDDEIKLPGSNSSATALNGTQANPYEEGFNAAAAGSSPAQSTYDYLRSTSAKSLVDSQIQLANARQVAQKNAQARLGAMGLGNTGYAGVAANGIQTAYMQGLENASNTYAQSMNEIAMQEAQGKTDTITRIQEALSYATDADDIRNALSLANISYENGVLGGDGLANLSDEQKRFIQYYISSAEKNFYGDAIDLDNVGEEIATANGWEINYLKNHIDEYAKEGNVVRLANGNNDAFTYLIFRNGQWYKTTSSAYAKANDGSKFTIQGADEKGSKANIG